MKQKIYLIAIKVGNMQEIYKFNNKKDRTDFLEKVEFDYALSEIEGGK